MKSFIVANWKMNMIFKEIEAFFQLMEKYYHTIDFSNREVLIAPASPYFLYLKNIVKKRDFNIKIGLQNCHYEDKGAFTGEVSPLMAADIGADFVIIGHSERRHIFKEDNEFINKKVKAVIQKELKVILCIGETLEQRENNKTEAVLEKQLAEGLKNVKKMEKLLIAYEPVWAIGTGKTATTEQIEETHNFIKNFLEKNIANNIPILYGGSVKPANIKPIMSINNVNGVLVGGASLKIEQFIKIINFDKEN